MRGSGDGKWVVGGYQADIDGKGQWVGTNYGEQFRGVLAKRGQKRIIGPDGTKRTVGSVGSTKGLLDAVNLDGWNEYHIVARGRHLVQKINGRVMSKLLDRHSKWRRKGVIAFQLHAGPPMKVWFRNVRLKKLPPLPKEDKKKVVFVAGRRSHGFAAHEHKAGCKLLAETLEWNTRNVTTEVHTGGWPDDPTAFKGADSLVMYCDGGGGHMVNDHLEQVDKLANKGVGIVALHYGVEVPKGKPGDRFLDWIGGYFEAHRSVNPHWTAEFSALPDHPITTGVEPFSIHDEWYYHMRFRENMEGVTPILTDLPPDSTSTQRWSPDQAATSHHGNPDVYKAVVKKDRPQHMAWAVERENGGRGFGFTGGHYHWNWGHDAFRKLVANAIAWSAHATLPRGGVASVTPTVPELMANQDYDPPKGFDPAKIRRKLRKWDEQTVSK